MLNICRHFFTLVECSITLGQKETENSNQITTILMWSGAHGSTHDSGARGPGFDLTPKPRMAFFRKLSSPFFQTTDLKMISFICNIVMSSCNK